MSLANAPSEAGLRVVSEALRSGPVPFWSNAEWAERFPWVIQGTTGGSPSGGGEAEAGIDFGLFGRTPVGEALSRWARLRESAGVARAVHARQVHGARVARWVDPDPAGLLIADGYDAHVTESPGVLLTISVADCVPVFFVSEEPRIVAIAHAGWRGIAGGVVESTLESLRGAGAAGVIQIHCGPSICGQCYEVGPEVHEALRPDRMPPDGPEPIDLVSAIQRRVRTAGSIAGSATRSAHCTRCGPGTFFSHRAGSSGRQLGVIGIRG